MADERHPLTIRLTTERHDWLREQAFRRRVSMQRIVDEAVDLLRQTSSPRGREKTHG